MNIPTKISRLNRLIKKTQEPAKTKDYSLQKAVHEKDLIDRMKIIELIKHVPVDKVKKLL